MKLAFIFPAVAAVSHTPQPTAANWITLIIVVVIAAVIYFLPSFIALRRRYHNATAILVLNIFLGWTFLGWVAALVWASTEPRPRGEWRRSDPDIS